MARRGDAHVFQHVMIEIAEKLPIDFVLGERLRVLAETESSEPLTDVGHGATLTRGRPPGEVSVGETRPGLCRRLLPVQQVGVELGYDGPRDPYLILETLYVQ